VAYWLRQHGCGLRADVEQPRPDAFVSSLVPPVRFFPAFELSPPLLLARESFQCTPSPLRRRHLIRSVSGGIEWCGVVLTAVGRDCTGERNSISIPSFECLQHLGRFLNADTRRFSETCKLFGEQYLADI
jgi:hypothetical protein